MKLKNIFITIVFLAVSFALLYVASAQLGDINKSRKDLKLVSNEPLENAPPSLAFTTVAMGAFRGLVVDILWMRADRLKEEGQFFDAKQLADWITVLQPRFAAVWDFQAWNMAYNISVAMPASQPNERWKWVKNGYELLRDKGIVKNPHSISLYRSLAWIFQHKIGGLSDDAHKYYKLQLAKSLRPLIDPGTNEHFDRLAKAPLTLDEMLKDEKVAAFIEDLRAADTIFADNAKLVENFLAMMQSPEVYNDNVSYVIDKYKNSPEMMRFDDFAKAYMLRNTWKFDIDFMIKLNKKYGPTDLDDEESRLPLNWTHPDAHAIYWAELGLKLAGKKGVYTVDEKNTDRIVFHSLQSLYRTGKIVIYDTPIKVQDDQQYLAQEGEVPTSIMSTVFLLPDLRMFKPYDDAMKERIQKYLELEKSNEKTLLTSHRNMLTNAVLSFYQAGHMKMAEKVYKELRERYPREDNKYPLIVFCRNRIKEEVQGMSITDATEMIIMMLREAYFRYAIYDDNEAAGRESLAKQIYDYYQQESGNEEYDRISLPDLNRMRYLALINFLNDDYFPPDMRQRMLDRIRNEKPELFEKLDKEREKINKEIESQQN